jgi:acetolactate synthase-1/2/3 large subunit
MKLTDYIAEELSRRGIEAIFGYTGGSIADLIDSIGRSNRVKFVENYHEQASAFAANAYAQITGRTGVALSSSGPGACNLIGGVANAFYDSIACVFITGNAHSLARAESPHIRQNAFQETDIVSIVRPITKHAVYINDPDRIRFELEKAFFTAHEGRKGPVLLDIPYNVQRENIAPESLAGFRPPAAPSYNFNATEVLDRLRRASRPVMLIGGGALGLRREMLNFLEAVPLPVVASLRALDVVPHDHKCFLGFIGSYGHRYANLAVKHSDLLLILGSRLDERQMGTLKGDFAAQADIIQVDIDEYELGRKVDAALALKSDAGYFLREVLKAGFDSGPLGSPEYEPWLAVLSGWKNKFPSYRAEVGEVEANGFIRRLTSALPTDAVICADVGQTQMCLAQAADLSRERRLLNSAGLGSMGYSLPASIGATYAVPGRPVVSFNGDGGVQMNIQELQTVARDGLPVQVVILNNRCLGMIRCLQEKLFDGRYFASVQGFSNPDFAKIAEAYGLPYCSVVNMADYDKAVSFVSTNRNGIIEVSLPRIMQACPEVGGKICEQLPALTDEDEQAVKADLRAWA